MVRSTGIAEEYATKFAELLGAGAEDGAQAVMAARPAELVTAFERLIVAGQRAMLGAFAAGPTCGSEYLPADPVEAMREGKAHRVPLIVGTNAEEARLFGRFIKLLPMTEPMIERLLAGTEPAERERITSAYPGYPDPAACVQFGGDFAFGAAAWQSPRRTVGTLRPICTATTTRHERCAGRVWAPPTRPSCWRCSTSIERLSGSCCHAAADRKTALRVSDDVQPRWQAFAQHRGAR